MSAARLCDACGAPVKGGIGLGGAMLCRPCGTDISAECERLHGEGKRVNALGIARARYRAEHSAGDYLLRDVPADLWAAAKHRAIDDGTSLRELVLAAVRAHLAAAKD